MSLRWPSAGHREHQIVVQLLSMDTGGKHLHGPRSGGNHFAIVGDPALLDCRSPDGSAG